MAEYADVAELGSRNIADVTDTDASLDAFKAHGGKLMTNVGTNDGAIFPRGVIHYYRQMASRYGVGGKPDFEKLQKFYRLFLAPGVDHCGRGAGPEPIDPFVALVNWVEHDVAPDLLLCVWRDCRASVRPNAAALPISTEGYLQWQWQHRRC